MWSTSLMPIAIHPSLSRFVVLMSSLLGWAVPVGWLCAIAILEAFTCKHLISISLTLTREESQVPIVITSSWISWWQLLRHRIAECYYFGPDGYCLINTTTPDGYTVNADGAWVVNGVIQTKNLSSNNNSSSSSNKSVTNTYSNAEMFSFARKAWPIAASKNPYTKKGTPSLFECVFEPRQDAYGPCVWMWCILPGGSSYYICVSFDKVQNVKLVTEFPRTSYTSVRNSANAVLLNENDVMYN